MEEKQKSDYYVAPEVLKQILSGQSKVVKGDQDRIFLIDGREGSGKSTLALQLAYKLDPTLTINDIVFNGIDLQKRIRFLASKGIKNKCIIFDEAFNGLSSKSALSKMNKELVRMFMEMRQLNLFVFVVLPSLFLLEKYVAIFRSHALFHVFISRSEVKRRYFKIYNYQNKKLLFLLGQRMFSYGRPFINKTYRFYSKFPPSISRQEYDKKKLSAFHEEDKPQLESKYKIQRDFAIRKLYQHTKYSYLKISKLFSECEHPLTRPMIGILCKNQAKTKKGAKNLDVNVSYD